MWAEVRLEGIAMGLTEEQRNFYLGSYLDFCTECCYKCTTVPDGYCPSYCLILQKGALIPFKRIQEAYTRNKGDLQKVCSYIRRYRLC